MTNKILLFFVFFLITSANIFAATDPNNVDPEKEDSKKKTTVISPPETDSIHKGIIIKNEQYPFEEQPEQKLKKPVPKEEKKESKEDVQSFNFLYYILQTKISDFITY